MKRFIILMFSFILFFSCFVPITTYAELSEDVNTNIFRALQDAYIYSEGDSTNELGKIVKGAILLAEKVENGKVYIQWNEGLAYIDQEMVDFLDDNTEVDFISDNWNVIGSLNVIEQSEVRTSDGDIFALLSKGIKYTFVGSSENEYKVQLGKRIGYVDRSKVKEISKVEESFPSKIDKDEINLGKRNANNDLGKEHLQDKDSLKKDKQNNSISNIVTEGKPIIEKDKTSVENKNLSSFNIKMNNTPADSPYFKTLVDGVKIYDNSTGKLIEVGTLPKGSVIPIARDYNSWYAIQFGDKYGWVEKNGQVERSLGDQLKNVEWSKEKSDGVIEVVTSGGAVVYDNTSGKLIPYMTIKEGVKYPYIREYNSWYKIQVGNRIGWIEKSEVKKSTSEYVANYKLYVYKELDDLKNYSRQKNKIETLSYGDQVTILQTSGYASLIITPSGKRGWVQNAYLSDNFLEDLWLVKDGRNIRSGPSTSYSNIGYLTSNSRVRVLDYIYGNDPIYKHWYKIRTETGLEGWIWGAQYSANSTIPHTGANIIKYDFSRLGKVTDYITIFTPLATSSSITASEINRFIDLKTNGQRTMMTGMGDAFLKAAETSGINPIYLVAHAALETGWGRSAIVKDKYNYFGIGAIDSDPYNGAYDFRTKEGGIIGGAVWISDHYVNRKSPWQQPTLDNMRNNKNTHQYATDEAWHVKIASIAQELSAYLSR